MARAVDALKSQGPNATADDFTARVANSANHGLQELAQERHVVVACGHYEGIDERFADLYQPEEFSIGDYVLSGGELASMVLIDGMARLLPGVLGHEQSAVEDSFGNDGLLDHPCYTRPEEFRGPQGTRRLAER